MRERTVCKRPIGGMLHHGSAGDRRSCSHLRGHFPTHRTKIAKNRVWKLPQVWKHRTLPHLLGKPTERVSHSSHTPFLLSVNQRGSVLVSSGGQKILSLDNIPVSPLGNSASLLVRMA